VRTTTCSRRPARRRGFTLVEMLATVAALVIVLGLMVSLARYVRKQASDQFTKQLLAQLDALMQQYKERHKSLPAVPAFVAGAVEQGEGTVAGESNSPRGGNGLPVLPLLPTPSDEALPPESVLQQSARLNNRALLYALRVEARRYPAEFNALPPSFFAEDTLRDAWGTPIAFMPGLHPAIGMAMENRAFFLSAGPDRQFRTLEDNLFSYEEDRQAKDDE
jgi:prepilin-type N-terminal cleavage/methylation domain-containing protein